LNNGFKDLRSRPYLGIVVVCAVAFLLEGNAFWFEILEDAFFILAWSNILANRACWLMFFQLLAASLVRR
jgi:hypothetical protein